MGKCGIAQRRPGDLRSTGAALGAGASRLPQGGATWSGTCEFKEVLGLAVCRVKGCAPRDWFGGLRAWGVAASLCGGLETSATRGCSLRSGCLQAPAGWCRMVLGVRNQGWALGWIGCLGCCGVAQRRPGDLCSESGYFRACPIDSKQLQTGGWAV